MRVLSPEDYGIIAIATIIIAAMRRFSDFGINAALIKSNTLSDRVKANAYSLKLIISSLLVVFAFTISPYWAQLYDNNAVSDIIRFLSITFFINSFIFIDRVVLLRNLDYKKLIIPDAGQILVGSPATLVFAYYGFEYWSIVYGALLGTLTRAILFKFLVREKIRFQFDKRICVVLLSFGIWVFFGSLLFWAYTTVDNALIGKYLGITVLGYYAIAYRWGTFTAENIQNILSKILFPAFSMMKGDIGRIKKAFIKVVEINSLVVFPLTFGLMSVADYFIIILLGEKWIPAYRPLLILSVLGLLRSLESSAISIFYALNKPKIYTFSAGLILLLMLITLYPAIRWHGIMGGCLSVTGSFFISFVIQQVLLCRLIKLSFLTILQKWSLPFFSSLIMSIVILFMKTKMSMSNFSFILLILIGVLTYSAMLLLFTKGKIIRIIATLK